jgi:hypothetical protein
MASFTDKIPNFNPYVAQLPVEAMVQVGMQKQKQYDEGIQKIQTSIDNIAGLDVIRDVDKVYLQSKLNQLGNDLRTVAAGDFSNFQLVNSVNGMTNQIVKDKNVQTAVSSTAWARKEQAMMEEDRKNGKLTPDNEYVFNSKLSSWINNDKVGVGFNQRYIQHFDIDKFARETFDAVKPDGFSYDQIYQLDASGRPMKDARGNLIYSPTMTRMEKEGIFPAKVKATLEQIFSDPRVSQQLNITGQYNYRGLDPNQLAQKVSDQRTSIISAYEDQMHELILQRSMGKNVQSDIDNLEAKIATVNSAYDEYANSALSNPDAIRGALYKDDVNARYTTMFGQIKDKTQVMENPAWNQQWKMQIEANAQSRFAQELRQRKMQHANDMEYKYAALAQAKELAILSAKAKGKKLGDVGADEGYGPGGEPTEQAAQSSAIEVIRVQNADFEKAANNYSNASDGFIWETMLSKIPNNITKLNNLTSKGMTRNDAISLLINNSAKKAGKTPEEYKAYWSDRAITEYNKLTPEQKAERPIVEDAYQSFRNSKRIFDSQLVVKQKIDAQTKEQLAEVGEKIATIDLKPQTIIYKDKKYTLTKEDMFDLAIYKKGNLGFLESLFGGDEAKLLEQDSKMAFSRLQRRGKGELAEAFLKDNENVIVDDKGKSVNVQSSSFFEGVRNIANLPSKIMYQSERRPNRDWSQVHSIEGIINNQSYTDGLKKKAEIIQQHYGISPNRNIDVMTGDNEIDRSTLFKLKRWGAESVTGAGNLSPDYKKFNESLSDNINKNNIGARTIFDENNNPMVEVISYNDEGKRLAGLTLQPDQAIKIGIDLGTLYESDEAKALRNKLNYNNYQSSAGDPMNISTYISGDSWYDKTDFPMMRNNTKFDVQANIVFNNGKYYPFLYVSDENRKVIKQLDGDENLENLLTTLKFGINPTLIQGLLTTPNK